MPVKSLKHSNNGTIAKNGKRVPAAEKGKAPTKKKGHSNKPAARSAPRSAEEVGKQVEQKKPPQTTGTIPLVAKREPFKLPNRFEPFPGTICGTLADIRVKRQNAANEEHNMVDYLKTLDEWFTRHGDPGDLPPEDADAAAVERHRERLEIFRAKSTEYKRTEDARDAARSLQRWLAKKYDAIIDLAMNPKLHAKATDDAIIEAMKDGPDMPLFKMAKDKGAVEDGSTHREREDGTLEPGEDGYVDDCEYVNRPIETLAGLTASDGSRLVSDEAIQAMKEYGWEIIKHINNLDIPGLTPGDAKAIEHACGLLEDREKGTTTHAA